MSAKNELKKTVRTCVYACLEDGVSGHAAEFAEHYNKLNKAVKSKGGFTSLARRGEYVSSRLERVALHIGKFRKFLAYLKATSEDAEELVKLDKALSEYIKWRVIAHYETNRAKIGTSKDSLAQSLSFFKEQMPRTVFDFKETMTNFEADVWYLVDELAEFFRELDHLKL